MFQERVCLMRAARRQTENLLELFVDGACGLVTDDFVRLQTGWPYRLLKRARDHGSAFFPFFSILSAVWCCEPVFGCFHIVKSLNTFHSLRRATFASHPPGLLSGWKGCVLLIRYVVLSAVGSVLQKSMMPRPSIASRLRWPVSHQCRIGASFPYTL